ncbi:hypothetical protein ACFL35_10925 [Candidatus Riflebacteria bacterium]
MENYFNGIKHFNPQLFVRSISIPEIIRGVFGNKLQGMNKKARQLFSSNIKEFTRSAFWGTCMAMKYHFGDFIYSITKENPGKARNQFNVSIEVINSQTGAVHKVKCLLRKKRKVWKIVGIEGEMDAWIFPMLHTMKLNREEISDIFEVFIPLKEKRKQIKLENAFFTFPSRWTLVGNKKNVALLKHPAGVNIEISYVHTGKTPVMSEIQEKVSISRKNQDGSSPVYQIFQIFNTRVGQLWLKADNPQGDTFHEVIFILRKPEGFAMASIFSPQFDLICDVAGGVFTLLCDLKP